MIRRVCSPYNVNGVALACLPEALDDVDYVNGYVSQVLRGREELQKELGERGIRFWPSHANFVLANFGSLKSAFVQAMRRRGILVRDRSSDPGCGGCVRITVGTVEQTARLLEVLGEALGEISQQSVGVERIAAK